MKEKLEFLVFSLCVVKAYSFFPDFGHLLVLLNNITHPHWNAFTLFPEAFSCNWAHLVENAQIEIDVFVCEDNINKAPLHHYQVMV